MESLVRVNLCAHSETRRLKIPLDRCVNISDYGFCGTGLGFRSVGIFQTCVAANPHVARRFKGDSIMRRSLQSSSRSLGMLGLSAFALALTAYGAQADVMPVQNLTFNQFFPGGLAPKAIFTTTNVVGWTGGNGLISIDAPGTAKEAIRTQLLALSLILRPAETSSRRTAILTSRLRSTRSLVA